MAIKSLLKLPVVGYESEEAFLRDIHSMLALAKKQKGFISAEVWKSIEDGQPVYMVESEWATRADMSAMEHHPEHDEVMSTYPHQPIHLRLAPWVQG